LLTHYSFSAVIIDVNTQCPVANREVFVFKIVDISGAIKTEERYTMDTIQLPLDFCWVNNDVAVEAYTAKVWKEDSILLRIPAFPYTLL
jgi:hypothetical protein